MHSLTPFLNALPGKTPKSRRRDNAGSDNGERIAVPHIARWISETPRARSGSCSTELPLEDRDGVFAEPRRPEGSGRTVSATQFVLGLSACSADPSRAALQGGGPQPVPSRVARAAAIGATSPYSVHFCPRNLTSLRPKPGFGWATIDSSGIQPGNRRGSGLSPCSIVNF